MKKYFGLQKVILALTTLTLVGLSSCNDQNFDWDEAHATQQYEKFTNVFIKEFGQPAEGHQWGFDYAQIALNGGSSSSTPSTRGSYKWEMVNSPNNIGKYGSPEEITLKEHREVFAWFSNHIVTWKNNPNFCTTDGTGSNRDIVEGTAYVIDTNHPHYGSLLNYTNNSLDDTSVGTPIDFENGWVQTVAENPNEEMVYHSSKNKKPIYLKESIYYLFEGNYVQSDVNGNSQNNGVTKDAASVYFYKVINGTTPLYKDDSNNFYIEGTGVYKPFHNDEINVYSDKPIYTNANELTLYSEPKVKSGSMDYVCYWDYSITPAQYEHLKDWNSLDAAYGWGRQPSTSVGGKWYEVDGVVQQKTEEQKQIGTLITDANINNWTYGSSSSSSNLHDKFYAVYLKGDDYEGWYIGFDFEAEKPSSNGNERIFADGICNDWIIKVSPAGKSIYSNARIMCEDLGGNYGKSTTDIDYNDIVLDVTNEQSNWGNDEKVTLTLQAAGGTLPLIVTYNDNGNEYILFETHEMFAKDLDWQQKINQGGNYSLSDVEYKTMYNTEEGTASATPRTFVLYRNIDAPSESHKKVFYSSFDITKIGIKVYRHELEDYMSNPPHSIEPSSADWISLDNQYGEAPLMICVPSTVKWLKERHKIDDGYQNFREWVRSPSYEFWNTSVNNTHLCQ